ncbi:LD-carboxypeptidase [bacterium]|nr:LD-carboxypeptidase [bacterium]MBP9808833.1 LD-carboxypeptidase [bacterium]
MQKPRVLKKGDTVGIIAPSSPQFEPGNLKFATDWLTKMGLHFKIGANSTKSYSSYAGSDSARAEDLHTLWSDDAITAVLPMRGGAGASRILPKLDFSLFAQKPKILVGFSDITALLIAINQKSNLVTFHGPTVGLMFETAYTHSYYQKAIMSTAAIGLVADPPSEVWGSDYPPTRMVIAEGKGRGLLTGGCLTLIRGLMGTPYEIDCADRIVFLEDVDEEPHNIDRILTQMILAGKFDRARGVIIGDCSGCRPGGSKRNILPLNSSLEVILREHFSQLGIPVIYGLKLGHTPDKVTLPLGVMASLNVTASTSSSSSSVRFKIEEAACVDKAQSVKK